MGSMSRHDRTQSGFTSRHNERVSVRWGIGVEDLLRDGPNTAFLCDIVVASAASGDWQRVLDLVRARSEAWRVVYREDGEEADLPEVADRLLARSLHASLLISIEVQGLTLPIHGHVFGPEWIEFDVPARAIDGQGSLAALVGFVEVVGRALGKEVRATPEAAYEFPIFRYDPDSDSVHLG